jgi:hypothetical protein
VAVFVGGMGVEVGTPVGIGVDTEGVGEETDNVGVDVGTGVGRGVLTTVDVAVVGETEGKRVGVFVGSGVVERVGVGVSVDVVVGVPVDSTFVLLAVSVGVG